MDSVKLKQCHYLGHLSLKIPEVIFLIKREKVYTELSLTYQFVNLGCIMIDQKRI